MYNVLVVEDQDMPRQLLEIYIRSSENFHHLLSISNAAGALSICRLRHVDLILMDVMTELGHSGLDILKELTTGDSNAAITSVRDCRLFV